MLKISQGVVLRLFFTFLLNYFLSTKNKHVFLDTQKPIQKID